MDPPDLFSGLDDEKPTMMSQERRSRRAPAPTQGSPPSPRRKDASVELPADPVMFDALVLAEVRGDIITSGSEGSPADGVHARTSQHYKHTALDVRFAGDRTAQARAYADAGYVALIEKTHLHVQRYRA